MFKLIKVFTDILAMVNNMHMFESVHSVSSVDLLNSPAINSQICKKLISLTDDAYCTIKLYQGIFIHQPILVATIIKLANRQGLKNPVVNISEAIAVLGWKKVRGIISSLCLQAATKEQNKVLDNVWELSSLRTIICKLLSRDNEELEKLCYFLSFGRFNLAVNETNKYCEVIELVKAGCNIKEAEQAKFGYLSAELSAKLCDHWKLPSYFSKSLCEYEQGKIGNQITEILSLSERLSILILYQEEELTTFIDKLAIKNLDKTLSFAKRELANLKIISGSNPSE